MIFKFFKVLPMISNFIDNFWPLFALIFNILLLVSIIIFVVDLIRKRRRMYEQINRIEEKLDRLLGKKG